MGSLIADVTSSNPSDCQMTGRGSTQKNRAARALSQKPPRALPRNRLIFRGAISNLGAFRNHLVLEGPERRKALLQRSTVWNCALGHSLGKGTPGLPSRAVSVISRGRTKSANLRETPDFVKYPESTTSVWCLIIECG